MMTHIMNYRIVGIAGVGESKETAWWNTRSCKWLTGLDRWDHDGADIETHEEALMQLDAAKLDIANHDYAIESVHVERDSYEADEDGEIIGSIHSEAI